MVEIEANHAQTVSRLNRFLACIAIPSHLSRVPPQRLLTGGTPIVLDASRLPPSEYQIAEQDADSRANYDSDETEDDCR